MFVSDFYKHASSAYSSISALSCKNHNCNKKTHHTLQTYTSLRTDKEISTLYSRLNADFSLNHSSPFFYYCFQTNSLTTTAFTRWSSALWRPFTLWIEGYNEQGIWASSAIISRPGPLERLFVSAYTPRAQTHCWQLRFFCL